MPEQITIGIPSGARGRALRGAPAPRVRRRGAPRRRRRARRVRSQHLAPRDAHVRRQRGVVRLLAHRGAQRTGLSRAVLARELAPDGSAACSPSRLSPGSRRSRSTMRSSPINASATTDDRVRRGDPGVRRWRDASKRACRRGPFAARSPSRRRSSSLRSGHRRTRRASSSSSRRARSERGRSRPRSGVPRRRPRLRRPRRGSRVAPAYADRADDASARR